MSEKRTIALKNLDIVIFDLDGVILNIASAVRRSTEEGMQKFSELKGQTEDIMEEMARLIEKIQTIPIPKTILNAKELLNVSFISEEEASVFKKLIIATYIYSKFKKYHGESETFNGIEKIIKTLKNKGKKIALLTNNRSTSASETLGKFGLLGYFDLIIGYNETEKLKPEPDGLLRILKDLGIKDKKKAVFIGDMTSDIICGRRADIKTVAVYSGLSKKEDLIRENPYIFVNDTRELGAVFGIKI